MFLPLRKYYIVMETNTPLMPFKSFFIHFLFFFS